MKNKMAADVDGSRHFSSLSRQAQQDLHCEILSVLEYFESRLDDYVIRFRSEQRNASEDLIHLLDSA